uniref:Secreted protein n=1 Tax=Bigelowiella natans TaxID=227086 RepID=A0A7S2KLJ0_BIGNA|mmetsp:Transcript_539/g.804  ORF Transcript_539/g.804 Transcript_539/m.804 type:complete len:119 (+) Transcript_539:686-1042(+)
MAALRRFARTVYWSNHLKWRLMLLSLPFLLSDVANEDSWHSLSGDDNSCEGGEETAEEERLERDSSQSEPVFNLLCIGMYTMKHHMKQNLLQMTRRKCVLSVRLTKNNDFSSSSCEQQ